MNIILPHLVSQDIIVKCISSLTTSIVSSYDLYNFITTHSNSDYQNYINEITSTDIANKLLVGSSLIKDVIKKHHFFAHDEKDMSVDKVIELYKVKFEPEVMDDGDYNMVNLMQNNNIVSNVPEPIKIALNSMLEIIDKINIVLNKIHSKIKIYNESYVKYVSKLNLSHDVDMLVKLDKIFDKRLNLFIDVLKIYSRVIN